MPRRCPAFTFKKKLRGRVADLFSVVAQLQRALDFAEEGDITNSYNIISTLGMVHNPSQILDFMEPSSDFLEEMHTLLVEVHLEE